MFGDVNFNAALAVDDPSALSLVRQPGSDGFRVDSAPMFQVFFISLLFVAAAITIRLNKFRELYCVGLSFKAR